MESEQDSQEPLSDKLNRLKKYFARRRIHRSPEEEGREIAEQAVGWIVSEAKSIDEVPAVIEALVASIRTELVRTDWALHSDFGAPHHFAVIEGDGMQALEPDVAQMLRDYQTLVEGIQTSTEVVLYEGLPDRFDSTYYDEWTTKNTVIIHGHRFYAETLPLQQEDAERLKELCCDPHNYELNGSFHSCLFHADYCLEWRSDHDVTQIQVCFTCGDIAGNRGAASLSVPFEQDPFKAILSNYHKNRSA